MSICLSILGIAIILAVLWDGFETMVLPRRVTRRFRFARLFYRMTWRTWTFLLRAIPSEKKRATFRGFFGPLSLLLLLCTWAAGLVAGFSLLYLAAEWRRPGGPAGIVGLGDAVYLSGTTFFTLGLGDVVPVGGIARALTVIQAGMGFGFLAVLIGHLPSLNQSFANREVTISLLDARAGSPPTACEILHRHFHGDGLEALRQLLYDWERWAAELLESHLSFPVLAFYRSQHDSQSWLSALTAILDVSALIIVGLEGVCEHQARLTFAMARHAVVDLAYVFKALPLPPGRDRLAAEELLRLRTTLAARKVSLRDGDEAEARLRELRSMYEPYVHALSLYLHLKLPPWFPEGERSDNWQTSAWGQVPGKKGKRPQGMDWEHF